MDLSTSTDVAAILRQWEDEHGQVTYNPVPILTRLAELIEMETENYYKMDPDPFDERHPSRADPDCQLGQMLKLLFRKDAFMTKLVNDYLRDNYWSRNRVNDQDIDALNIAACRLLLDTMPGLETSAIFQADNESLINRLLKWAQNSIEPLQSYATGLLAAAMDVQDVANKYREQNGKLTPLMLERLWKLQSGQEKMEEDLDDGGGDTNLNRPFAHLSKSEENGEEEMKYLTVPQSQYSLRTKARYKENGLQHSPMKSPAMLYSPDKNLINNVKSPTNTPKPLETPNKRAKPDSCPSPRKSTPVNTSLELAESSNSSWAELENYVIGNFKMYPPTASTKQILILKYLTPMGEYQEFLSYAFEMNALSLILNYVNVKETKDSRLAFEALKYLSALLCHKKFSIEFIHAGGLQRLLDVPRPSVAATGVSICLYYLAYCPDAMEKVCLLPEFIIKNCVKYVLWLIECTHHDSSRCHSIMFFGLTFSFQAILNVFDEQDGLRKCYNVISTLPILSIDDDQLTLNDDVVSAARQIVRHVCVLFKRYLEAHLYIKSEQLKRSMIQIIPYKAMCKCNSLEDMQERIDTLLELMPYRAHWAPVDELLRLGAITILLQIIAFAYEWNFSGRSETVKSALDVLMICAVMPRVQILFGERVELPEDAITIGVNVILGAAEGEIVADPDVQKAALAVIVSCVCSPIHRPGGSATRFSLGIGSPRKKSNLKNSEELIQKVWESVRSQNGIMVLLQLMQVKTPITDADSIRTLACRALAGLARSDTVKQIVGKLPLFTNGQLQNLMRDPILQEKRQEHVLFQKYALELMERVSGNTKPNAATSREIDASLSNIHRANIVAQTKIQFNDRQLLQLIHQHLAGKGLIETANVLQREAQLTTILPPPGSFQTPPTPSITKNMSAIASSSFSPRYISPALTPRSRLPYHHKTIQVTQIPSTPPPLTPELSQRSSPSSIKINRRSITQSSAPPTTPRLEKQIASSGVPNISTVSLQSGTLIGEDVGSVVPRVTLESIITEYLTNQHALCKNPMATCPQFNLFQPHKCPDPRSQNSTLTNFTMRTSRRSMGYVTKDLDRRLIHSRFCPVQTFRVLDDIYTYAQFLPQSDNKMMVGTFNGEVKIFNVQSGSEESSYQCHDSLITNLRLNRTGKLLLTSSSWRLPLSALWDTEYFESKFTFEEEEYVEFSNLTQDKVIGTKGEVATIYDVTTGVKLFSLQPTITNQYTKNKATFSNCDELILSDGVLWDPITQKQVHKFDKLNQTQSGVFHPNGLEVVSNTEVWDLRTFHLLRTVPSLNQCQVFFNNLGDIIYGVALEQETDEETEYDTSFKTLDAKDYSSIATIDVKKNIYSLCINRYDTQIALVENQGLFENIQESVVRIYDVGRIRDNEDDQEEEEEDEEIDNSDDDVSGSGSESGENSINLLIDAVAAATNSRNRRNRNRQRGNAAAPALPAVAENGEEQNNDDEDWESVNEDSSDDDDDDDDDDDGGAYSMSDSSGLEEL